MNIEVMVKVKCANTQEWYEIHSHTDLDELYTTIQEELQEGDEDMTEDIELTFDEWEFPTDLLSGFEGSEIPADLPEAIEALEDANLDIEMYVAYADNIGSSPTSASDMQDLIRDAEEAYQGEFDSDEDFARDMADQLGSVDKNASWPMNCIDWEQAASELMYDYFENSGYYFRNI